MTYVLITRFTDQAPELELFSEMPTFDMTIPDHNHDTVRSLCTDYEHGPHAIQYNLYEGHVDGGDAREISILRCDMSPTEACYERHPIRSMRVIDHRDPTELYMLTCGHETMGF